MVIDARTGEDRVIPVSAKVSQPVSTRLNFPIRVDDGPVKARLIQEPEPSPDGKRLAFSALTRLYLMDLPGGQPRQLSAEGSREFHPSWSPDGKWIAYVSWSPEGGHIWKRPGDGSGQPTRLTRAAAFFRDPSGRLTLARAGDDEVPGDQLQPVVVATLIHLAQRMEADASDGGVPQPVAQLPA